MPEDLIKNEKDRVLVNHALSDIYSGLKVPADTMKYLEDRKLVGIEVIEDAEK